MLIWVRLAPNSSWISRAMRVRSRSKACSCSNCRILARTRRNSIARAAHATARKATIDAQIRKRVVCHHAAWTLKGTAPTLESHACLYGRRNFKSVVTRGRLAKAPFADPLPRPIPGFPTRQAGSESESAPARPYREACSESARPRVRRQRQFRITQCAECLAIKLYFFHQDRGPWRLFF